MGEQKRGPGGQQEFEPKAGKKGLLKRIQTPVRKTPEPHLGISPAQTPDLSTTLKNTATNNQRKTFIIAVAVMILLLGLSYIGYSLISLLFQEKDENEDSSFFISTHFICDEIKLGAYVVATSKAHQFKVLLLKEELKLDVELNPFMMGKIIGIIDESQYLVIIQIFPNKVYKKNHVFNAFCLFGLFKYLSCFQN